MIRDYATRVPRFRLGSLYPSTVVLVVLAAALLTLSYAISTLTVASIPVALLILAGLILVNFRWVLSALKERVSLKVFAVIWIAWMAASLLRLSVDYRTYESLAIRDAVIGVCFAGVFVGAAAVYRYGLANLERTVAVLLAVMAVYSFVYPFRSLMPAALQTWLSIQNVSVGSIVLIAAAMWLPGRGFKLLTGSAGVLSLFLVQSRTMYLVVLALVAMFLMTRLNRADVRSSPSLSSRVLIVAAVISAAVAALAVIGQMAIFDGRVGSASLDTVAALVSSLFDDSSDLAGSRHEREIWWDGAVNRLFETPTSVFIGVGLGPDLANGFSINGQLIRKPHNDFLETAVRFGLPIGLAFAGTVGFALLRGFRARATSPVVPVLLSWTVASTVNALGQPYLSYPHGAIPMALAIGVLMVLPYRGASDAAASRALASSTRARSTAI